MYSDKGDLMTCESTIIHQDIIDKVENRMPTGAVTERAAGIFKQLGDPTRLRILVSLAEHEMCVCDISALLQMSQSAISHQLKSLRLSNLVISRKEGKAVYYSLADEHVIRLLEQGMLHAEHC
ncbi:MAG: winged helix-turn-helix transcriptional regulator [Tissierellia bacterium]|jgi:DNA-binding transcriptional ArsR family regulator|nr:winged helix-turn-helix transcriptional regulator [Tissierellia bacterium]